MNKPPDKPDIGFDEALRRIAKTPKHVIEGVVNPRKVGYNAKEATKKPPPAKHKP